MYAISCARAARVFPWRGLLLAVTFLLTSLSLQADVCGSVRQRISAACYCRCAVSRARGGCAKMCESRRYASRWWAMSCARPRRDPLVENPGASPRMPHPDRAEHARL